MYLILTFTLVFLDQQLYVCVLKHLSTQMASSLFYNSNLSLGVQVEFYYRWSQWIQIVDQNQTVQKNTPFAASNSQIKQANDLHAGINSLPSNSDHKVTTSVKTQNAELLNLNAILSTGPYGPNVLSYYKINHNLNDMTRKLLVEAFLYYCITTNISVTKAACKSLSIEIAKTFNGEIAVSIINSYAYLPFVLLFH